jgi:ring-1,2-phenylacetyl-CoA epoxidase subunit PaaC
MGTTLLSNDELLRHADRAMILAQRLTEWIAHAPDLEEDMALANLGLDLLGQARSLYTLAGEREGAGRTEDDFAYLRPADDFRSPALVEQPNGDFAATIVRQFLHDAYAIEWWTARVDGPDPAVGALAAKVVKETTYHLRYSRGWLVRLGDGTDESHRRMTAAVEAMWPFVDDLFAASDAALRPNFDDRVAAGFAEATLAVPTDIEAFTPATEPSPLLIELLAEMQSLHRAHPGVSW